MKNVIKAMIMMVIGLVVGVALYILVAGYIWSRQIHPGDVITTKDGAQYEVIGVYNLDEIVEKFTMAT